MKTLLSLIFLGSSLLYGAEPLPFTQEELKKLGLTGEKVSSFLKTQNEKKERAEKERREKEKLIAEILNPCHKSRPTLLDQVMKNMTIDTLNHIDQFVADIPVPPKRGWSPHFRWESYKNSEGKKKKVYLIGLEYKY